ncbi:MAG: HEAT repeat domain-containing protein, partial [Myxococcales bacterium]|nr:HEAT repeat domain-containing protein [Myxococcales bacterium]
MLPSRAPSMRARGRAPDPSRDEEARALGRRRRLGQELERVEAELDALNAMISSGLLPKTTGSDDEDPGSTRGEAPIARYQRLRGRADELSLQLARLDRLLARQRRLDLGGELRSSAAGADAPSPRDRERHAEPPPGSASDRAFARRRAKAFRLAAQASPRSRAEKLALEEIVERLFDPEPEMRRGAAAELATMGGAEAMPLLRLALADPNTRARQAALNGLGSLRRAEAAEFIAPFIDDPNPQLRIAALRGLASSIGDSASAALLRALEDPNVEVRRVVATLLGWRSAGPVVRGLLFGLQDPDELVRLRSIESLQALGDDRAVFALIRTLDDASGRVREAAARALHAIVAEDVLARVAAEEPQEIVPALSRWWCTARITRRHAPASERDRPPTAPPIPRASSPEVAADASSVDAPEPSVRVPTQPRAQEPPPTQPMPSPPPGLSAADQPPPPPEAGPDPRGTDGQTPGSSRPEASTAPNEPPEPEDVDPFADMMPDGLAPEGPAPDDPAPEVSAPEVSALEVSAPEVPAPEVPAPEVPAPEVPAPSSLDEA